MSQQLTVGNLRDVKWLGDKRLDETLHIWDNVYKHIDTSMAFTLESRKDRDQSIRQQFFYDLIKDCKIPAIVHARCQYDQASMTKDYNTFSYEYLRSTCDHAVALVQRDKMKTEEELSLIHI